MSDQNTEVTTPLVSLRAEVLPEWIDWNGHMNVAYYVLAFDMAADNLFDLLGIGDAYRKATNCSSFTLELHVNYLKEIHEGEKFEIRSQLLGIDRKRLHIFQEMIHAETGDTVATNENMFIHIDMEKRRSSPFPDRLLKRMRGIAEAHALLERPVNAGRSIGF